MKLKGPLSPSAFDSLVAGFENRIVSGMEPQNARYLSPRDIARLKTVGLLPETVQAADEAVVCNYVRLRSPKGERSWRVHSLLVLFPSSYDFTVLVLPTDWSLSVGAADGSEEQPKMKQCTYDICFTRGAISTCERKTAWVAESEAWNGISNEGCPGSACSSSSGGSFDIGTILAG